MIVVAGVVTVRVARQFESFPIPFVSSTTNPGDISIRLAGVGWTVARTLQRLGSEVTFATYVGTDLPGHLASLGLREHGLTGPAVLSTDYQPRAMVLYDRDGRRCGASDLRRTPRLTYPPEIFAGALPAHCRAAVLTNIGFTRSLIPVVVERGIPFATDLHLVDDPGSAYNQDWMRAAHVLACSHEGLPTSPEQWIRDLWARYGTEIAIVGCGAGGAVLGVRERRRIWHVPASAPRGVRFMAGAGDTLLATFAHHFFDAGHPVVAIQHAVLAAGWKVGGSADEEAGVPARVLTRLVARHGLPGVSRLG